MLVPRFGLPVDRSGTPGRAPSTPPCASVASPRPATCSSSRPTGRTPPSPFLRMQRRRLAACLRAAHREHAGVEAHLRTAPGELAALGYPYWRALCEEDLADELDGRGRPDEAAAIRVGRRHRRRALRLRCRARRQGLRLVTASTGPPQRFHTWNSYGTSPARGSRSPSGPVMNRIRTTFPVCTRRTNRLPREGVRRRLARKSDVGPLCPPRLIRSVQLARRGIGN
jgi:hypothetical protein